MALESQPYPFPRAREEQSESLDYSHAADSLREEAQADMALGDWDAAPTRLQEVAARRAPPARAATREDVRRARAQYQARLAVAQRLPEPPSRPAPRWSDEPAVAPRREHTRLRTALLGGLIGLLAVGCVGLTVAGLQARGEIEARNAAIATQQQTINDITGANLRFQSELTAVRSERDGLQKRLAESEAAAGDLRGRAEKAENRGAALADVVKLDEEIYTQLAAFLQESDTATRALARRDYVGAINSYARLERISGTLKPLFDRRKALTSRL
ncbi:MAG TPA: hypothetical protein VFE37_11100 [Chloroflexota bacterium]|nr:hypothetical protein [Chloroflexota bacterium]